MTGEPSSPANLADHFDQALGALWQGDDSALERLLESSVDEEDPSTSGSASGLGEALRRAAIGWSQPVQARWIPDIPGFEDLREIGRGGMGVVYEAMQLHPRRRVAIKVMHAGRETDDYHRMLFGREIQALASLDHPGVASLYHAGTTADGRMYFVMELVRGRDLLEYARSERLDTPARLRLFGQVCEAVHHAHLRGVIHRDLKPSNILVQTASHQEPPVHHVHGAAVKVLDFGLARFTDGSADVSLMTDSDRIKGTIAYMSPEQMQPAAEGAVIDARADVYALGVVLYQLLCDQLPYQPPGRSLAEMLRTLENHKAKGLGKVRHDLRGDLEVITATAMAREIERRYQSAAQLADDIRRHLQHEPIAARPATAAYQLRKFARRNKALVIGVSAALLMLVVGFIGTGLSLMHARAAQQQGRLAQHDAERSNDFLNRVLASANPQIMRGRNFSVQSMIDAGIQLLDEGALAGHHVTESNVRSTFGKTYQSLGLYPQAQVQFEVGLRLARTAAEGDQSLQILVADRALELAGVHVQEEHWDEGQRLSDEALRLRQTYAPDDRAAIRNVQRTRARVMEVLNRRVEGGTLRQAIYHEALAESASAETEEVVELQFEYAKIATSVSADPAFAEQLLRETLAAARRLYGDLDEHVAARLVILGSWLVERSAEESEKCLNEALAIRTQLYGDDHPSIAGALYNLGYLRNLQRRHEEALEIFQRCLSIRERHLAPGHYSIGRTQYRVGKALLRLGRHQEAEPYYRAALQNWRDHLPVFPRRGMHFFSGLATCLIKRQQFEETEPLLLEMHEVMVEHEPSLSWRRIVYSHFIDLYDKWERPDQAEHWRTLLKELPASEEDAER